MRDRNQGLSLPIDYFDWLGKFIDFRSHSEYSELLLYLFRTEFVWSIRNDVNRAKDGIELRYDFLNEYYVEVGDTWIDEPCSVYEMLIALARRVRFDIMPDYDYDVEYWFWTFLDNLDLLVYDNRYYSENEVDEIVKNFLKRQYFTGGKFCMFFTKKHGFSEILRTELWYQVQFWLDEKYDF